MERGWEGAYDKEGDQSEQGKCRPREKLRHKENRAPVQKCNQARRVG